MRTMLTPGEKSDQGPTPERVDSAPLAAWAKDRQLAPHLGRRDAKQTADLIYQAATLVAAVMLLISMAAI